MNHPFTLFGYLFAFPLVLCCLKTHVHKKLHDVIGRIGKKCRDPMELVHMIRRVYTVGCTERTEHFGRELEINNINNLVAVKPKFAPGYAHYYRIPFSIICMAEYHRLKILIKRIVRRCAIYILRQYSRNPCFVIAVPPINIYSALKLL